MSGRGWVVAGLACVGCGGVDTTKMDAAVKMDSQIDGPGIDAPQGRCDLTKPFGAPVPITELNTTAEDDGAWLTADEKTIFWSSSRPNGQGSYDIWTATRSSPTAAFENIAPVAGVNTSAMERRPALTPDLLTLYAERIVSAGGPADYDILHSTRSSTSAAFPALTKEPSINGIAYDANLFVTPDHFGVFDTNRGGYYDVYMASWNGTQFEGMTEIPNINDTVASDGGPVMTADKLTLYFSSDRTGNKGGGDVYVSTRTSASGTFSMPVNVDELNTAAVDYVNWISADGCVISITRRDSTTLYDLYMAVKPL